MELLVAVALFALVGAAAFSGLQAVAGARTDLAQRLERLGELQLAFHRLQQDLLQAVPRGILDPLGIQRPPLASPTREGDVLTLTRGGWANPLGLPRADLQRVAYRIENGQLLRRHWLHLDRIAPDPGVELPLLKGIQRLELRFWAQGRWHDRWPPATAAEVSPPPLPQGLEARFEFDDGLEGDMVRLWLVGAGG